jgi:hypothetical protein
MKKKLFVWAYTRYLPTPAQTCALTADGKLLFAIYNDDHKETVRLLFSNNATLQEEYDIVVQNQEVLEKHMYEGEPRETLNEDFRLAWDKYKLGAEAGN